MLHSVYVIHATFTIFAPIFLHRCVSEFSFKTLPSRLCKSTVVQFLSNASRCWGKKCFSYVVRFDSLLHNHHQRTYYEMKNYAPWIKSVDISNMLQRRTNTAMLTSDMREKISIPENSYGMKHTLGWRRKKNVYTSVEPAFGCVRCRCRRLIFRRLCHTIWRAHYSNKFEWIRFHPVTCGRTIIFTRENQCLWVPCELKSHRIVQQIVLKTVKIASIWRYSQSESIRGQAHAFFRRNLILRETCECDKKGSRKEEKSWNKISIRLEFWNKLEKFDELVWCRRNYHKIPFDDTCVVVRVGNLKIVLRTFLSHFSNVLSTTVE